MNDRVSIGLHGRTPAPTIARVAARAEQAGFRALWLNDVPGGDSLAGLASAADATAALRLGAGVIPLDRRPASEILESLAKHDLPPGRLTIGVGSGGAAQALARVEEGLATLHAGTVAELVVGALGPRMRALGARASGGLLLNWLTPAAAADARRSLRLSKGRGDVSRAVASRASANGSGAEARAILYARTITSADARSALEAEAGAYASYPLYAANFARLGFGALDSTIDGTDPARLADAVAEYLGAVDELVLRVVTPTGSEDELLRFVDAAAAAL